MMHRDELRDHPAGVVADQHHVVEVKGGKYVGDDPRDTGDGSVGAGAQRLGCAPSGQVGAMHRRP